MNGDGYGDVIVGADSWDAEATNEGRAYVYLGSTTGLGAAAAWTADPTDQASAYFGNSVASAGDVNGDGFGDVIVGAPNWDGAATDKGRAYVYYGGDGAPGLGRALAQYRADGTTRIGVGNLAGGTTVVLAGRVTQEGGAGGRLALEVEVKAIGTPFDGDETALSPTVVEGATATATVAGLTPGAKRWRARVV